MILNQQISKSINHQLSMVMQKYKSWHNLQNFQVFLIGTPFD